MLSPAAEARGEGLRHLDFCGSTMDEARALFEAGASRPVWVVADAQGAGRGRHGRGWASPPGNLYASVLLPEPCAPGIAPQLGFVAGLALHDAVAAVSGLAAPALALKWPNDLVLGGAKLAGLLLEAHRRHGAFAVIAGFGVNIVAAPSDTPYPAASLAGAGAPASRNELLARLADSLAGRLCQWRRDGFAATRADWLARAAGQGAPVRFRPPAGEVCGTMAGLDEAGRLLIETEAGLRAFDAGDLFPGLAAPG